ncbi:MAG: hypothetical protein WBX00_24705 [Isosphaeraceae bacterium]
MMTNSNEPQTGATQNRIELAVAVAQRIEIRNVVLTRCEANRDSKLDLKRGGTLLQYGITEVGFAKDDESKLLCVLPTFILKVTQERERDTASVLSVTATFALFYTIDSFDGLTDLDLEAFSRTNGVFNAWPYWREFAQSTTARMGLESPITLPVFRIGEEPFDDQAQTNR